MTSNAENHLSRQPRLSEFAGPGQAGREAPSDGRWRYRLKEDAMMRRVMGLVLAAGMAALASLSAAAQSAPICDDRANLLDGFARHFAERPRALGLSSDGGVIELLTSPGGTWTLMVTYPERPSCVIAVGELWESLPAVPTGPDA